MKFPLCTLIAGAMLFLVPASPAQEAVVTPAPVSVVPHLIKYSGALPGAPAKAETVDVKFSLYAAQTGGDALWTETQQVSLDSAGKYSVLLGSVATLPSSAFANGQARWIGVTLSGEQESARTVLVATPYSLKASDAETLGGHPVSDFTLKNAVQPAGATNITQINVGNGVTGGGTGPTVTLGLSSTYLEKLGNEIYPQIGGTNTMTGTNKFTAGKLLIGTSPVLSASAITGASPVTATVSGNTVKIGLSDSALLTLGNGVYAQLGAANTFTKIQTFASGQTFPGTVSLSGNNAFTGTNSFSKAVSFASGQTFPNLPTLNGANSFSTTNTFLSGLTTDGVSSSGQVNIQLSQAGLYALFANNTSTSGSTFTTGGVAGQGNDIGVYGFASDSNPSHVAYGVYGETAGTGKTDAGIYGTAPSGGRASGVYGSAPSSSAEGAGQTLASGVWGDSNGSIGVFATSDSGYGAVVANNSQTAPTIFIENDDKTGNGFPFQVYNAGTGAQCTIDESANFSCDGNYAATNSVQDRKVTTYGVQSAENWIEDFGTAQLAAGSVHVALDPTFAATVNTGIEYHVFLTPQGESEQIYVTNKSADGFDVREAHRGRSNIAIDYRIVAKRKGSESLRLEDVTVKRDKLMQHLPARRVASLPAK